MRRLLFMFVFTALCTITAHRLLLPPVTLPAPKAFSDIDLNLIRRVECFDAFTGNGGVGTAWMIKANTMVTAAHVVGTNPVCDDVDTHISVTVKYIDRENDFAIVSMPFKYDHYIRYSCEGFETQNQYMAVGWKEGLQFTATYLTGEARVTSDDDNIDGMPFGGVRYFLGNIYEGMSGGPVFDDHGRAIGINSATDLSSGVGYSRDLKDTILCGKPRHKPVSSNG